jgi:hypothetical protein
VGNPDASAAHAVRCRARWLRKRGNSRPVGMWHRSTMGREYPCVPKAAEESPGAFEGPCSGGNSGAEAARMDLTEPKPTEARASNGFAGGNSRGHVQNPLVFWKRSLTRGVHGRFGEGNPEGSFNDRRSGFGRAEGRPSCSVTSPGHCPTASVGGRCATKGMRADEGSWCFEEHRLGLFSCQERGICPTGSPGKAEAVRWSRLGATQVAASF